MSTDDPKFEAELQGLLAAGKKIEAIKLYREQTGADLAAAKNAVEAMERAADGSSATGEEVHEQIVELLREGRKIQAIKVCRENTGMGLKESKELVEALAVKHGLETKSGGGCLGVVVLFALLLAAGAAWAKEAASSNETASSEATYTNPVGERPIHMGDPFVLRHDGGYTLFGTNAPYRGFRCYTSKDLVHWQPAGWAYRETPDSWADADYWAPEVKEYRGKYYMTYSALNKASDARRLLIALAVSDKPEGPYRDLYAPWFDFGFPAIDGHIFVDDDGKPYLYFSRNGFQDGYSFGILYGVALADDLSGPIGKPVKLMEADQPWEKVRYAENRCNEGATVFKHDGRYYMTYSANHTHYPHYGIGYATADNPLGPWKKAPENPIAATDLSIGVSAPGHNSITLSPDGRERFIVYHTHADPSKPSGDRVVNIDRLVIDKSGRLKIVGPTRTPQKMPSGVGDE